MEFQIGILITLLSIIIYWYRWRKAKFNYFKNLGIPGPKPGFFTGNLLEISKSSMSKCQLKWTKKYGNIVGYFLGAKPILLVSDLEFVKFMITNHLNFVNRDWFLDDGGIPVDIFSENGIVLVKTPRWKVLRNILTPIFTSAKLKEMNHIMKQPLNQALKDLELLTKEGKPLDIFSVFENITFNMTMNTFFGIEIQEKKHHNSFIRDLSKLLSPEFQDLLIFLNICFSEISPVFCYVRQVLDILCYYLGKPSSLGAFKNCEKIVILRESNRALRRNDFLQLLLDSRMEAKETDEGTKNSFKNKGLSHEEIIANAITFALGGYDTTSATLTYFTHLMVKYPDIQEKLRKELQELKQSESMENGFIYGIPYLDQIIFETLRKFPIAPNVVSRITHEEMQYKSFTIPKNLTIQVAVQSLHHDPEIWPDPEHFDPERFSLDKGSRKSIGFQGFGFGPRNCIGTRMAQLTLRQIIANLLLNYKLEPCKETVDIKQGNELVVTRPDQPLLIKVVPLRCP